MIIPKPKGRIEKEISSYRKSIFLRYIVSPLVGATALATLYLGADNIIYNYTQLNKEPRIIREIDRDRVNEEFLKRHDEFVELTKKEGERVERIRYRNLLFGAGIGGLIGLGLSVNYHISKRRKLNEIIDDLEYEEEINKTLEGFKLKN